MLIEELAVDLNAHEEIAVVSYEPDDEVKAKKQITLTTEVIPFYLEKLEAIVKENNGYLALARVSIVVEQFAELDSVHQFLIRHAAHMGRPLPGRHSRLHQLHGEGRSAGKVRRPARTGEHRQHAGADQSLAGKATGHRRLSNVSDWTVFGAPFVCSPNVLAFLAFQSCYTIVCMYKVMCSIRRQLQPDGRWSACCRSRMDMILPI